MVPWKVAWVVIGFSLTLIAGGLPILLGLNDLTLLVETDNGPWALPTGIIGTIAVCMLAAVLASMFVRQAVEYSELFDGTTESARSDITGLIVMAIVVHTAWIITFQFFPQWWMWWPAVLLAASGIEYGAAWSYEYLAAVKARKQARRGVVRDDGGNALDSTSQVMARALQRAGLGTVVVDSWEELRDSDRHPR